MDGGWQAPTGGGGGRNGGGLEKEEEEEEEEEEDDDDDDDDDDEVKDATYGPKKKRQRLEKVTLQMPVKDYLDSFSRIGDRRNMSFAARSDAVTIGLEKAGVDLTNVPCSTSSMHRCLFYQ